MHILCSVLEVPPHTQGVMHTVMFLSSDRHHNWCSKYFEHTAGTVSRTDL